MREAKLQRAILAALNAQVDVWAMRVNAGRRGGVRLAPEGTADIVGIGPGGFFFGGEVKVPGKKPSEVQSLWLHRIEKLGGFVDVWTSTAECLATVRRMRERAGRSGRG